jgi:nucleoside-diphosphate-sugar epimerase
MQTDFQQLYGDHFADRRVLVTGGAGFIGSHLIENLVALGADVVAIDDLSGGDWANLSGVGDNVRQITGSILDENAIAEAVAGCDVVFHQAALGSVPRSVNEPLLYHQVNVMGTVSVLEAARAANVRRVVYAASSSAYGDPPNPDAPKVETQCPSPLSPYAASKLAGEHAMRAYANCYDLDTACTRYFNIFGPRQNANSAYAAVIAAFAKALLTGQQPTIFGDGEQSRDFTFVHNVVQANLLAARAEAPLQGEVFNVACGQRVSINQLFDRMAKALGQPDAKPVHVEARAGDVRHSLADISKAGQVLGYEPLVMLDAGLAATCDWYASVM